MLGFWFFRAVMPLSQIGSGGKAPNEATERREIGEATDRVGKRWPLMNLKSANFECSLLYVYRINIWYNIWIEYKSSLNRPAAVTPLT